jgi:two-component system, OmpR family, response regulator
MDLQDKEVFTTGDVAEICQISQQTVIRCFDNGRLKGFRVPGSRFRRVPREALILFMKENGIPVTRLQRGKKRVLVVDDDPDIIEMLVDLLQADGRFEVKTAKTGYDAGLLTQQFNPDVMILDYMLPDINGNTVLQTVRKNPELAHIKVILVSGVVNQEEVQALLAAGANDFIKKPFDIDHLIKRIAELVGV